MKQFSIEEYLKNPDRKVVTRNGLPVRIICTDRNYKLPIIALILEKDGTEIVCSYNARGEYWRSNELTDMDLIFAPENKEGWVNVFRDSSGSGYKYAVIFNSEQEARNDVVENERCGYITTTKIEWEE